MLDGREDDPVAPVGALPARALGHAEDGEVVGLGSAAREDDLVGPKTTAYAARERTVRRLEVAGGAAPERVERVCVGDRMGLLVVANPCLHRAGAKRRGGRVV